MGESLKVERNDGLGANEMSVKSWLEQAGYEIHSDGPGHIVKLLETIEILGDGISRDFPLYFPWSVKNTAGEQIPINFTINLVNGVPQLSVSEQFPFQINHDSSVYPSHISHVVESEIAVYMPVMVFVAEIIQASQADLEGDHQGEFSVPDSFYQAFLHGFPDFYDKGELAEMATNDPATLLRIFALVTIPASVGITNLLYYSLGPSQLRQMIITSFPDEGTEVGSDEYILYGLVTKISLAAQTIKLGLTNKEVQTTLRLVTGYVNGFLTIFRLRNQPVSGVIL